jgi:toxin ParE1/3/4
VKYRVSKDARNDLDQIFGYWTGRASVEAADRLVDKIMERFWLIGEHPNAGPSADHIAPGVKCFPAGKYLIYYRKASRAIEILYVFHGARDQAKAFSKKTPRGR